MTMSIGYSFVLYRTSEAQLRRQVPSFNVQHEEGNSVFLPDDAAQGPVIRQYLEERAAEGSHALAVRLVVLNVLTMIGGAGLSYYLARRTLQPIEESMETQSQFVSDASHELRTPLTMLQTSNEVALRDEKLTLAKAKEAISASVEEAVKLKTLTDGLLQLARGDGEELTVEPILVQDVATDVMNIYMKAAQAKGMTIDDQVPALRVFANRQALEQAMGVLVDNAIKYGPNETTITLDAVKRGKRTVLRVRDQGPGIRQYDQRRIFDRFYRADQSRSGQHVAGTGIGLSLAKKLVERQGGEISVASTMGKGSTFSVALQTV
jgi:signal transduction histidine kinase